MLALHCTVLHCTALYCTVRSRYSTMLRALCEVMAPRSPCAPLLPAGKAVGRGAWEAAHCVLEGSGALCEVLPPLPLLSSAPPLLPPCRQNSWPWCQWRALCWRTGRCATGCATWTASAPRTTCSSSPCAPRRCARGRKSPSPPPSCNACIRTLKAQNRRTEESAADLAARAHLVYIAGASGFL